MASSPTFAADGFVVRPLLGTSRAEIKAGMTPDEVRAALGAPEAEVVFGERTRWTYPGLTVLFTAGKVTDVQF